MRRLKRTMKKHKTRAEILVGEQVEIITKPLVHAFMYYECEKCGKRIRMYVESGLEEFGENHKPTPFAIRCRGCGGIMHDVSGLIKLGRYMELPDTESYFKNSKESDCGIPIIRG